MLTLGPMTITKIKGNVEVGQTDTIAVHCHPEFVGSQEEEIAVVVTDSVPEDRDGKTVTLSVNSAIPSIDFQDLDSIFQQNHVVDGIQDFDCPKDVLVLCFSSFENSISILANSILHLLLPSRLDRTRCSPGERSASTSGTSTC